MNQEPLCALAGCDREVPQPEPGRPPRRYCCAEHREQAKGTRPRRPGGVEERGDGGAGATSSPVLAWPALPGAKGDRPFGASPRAAAEGLAGLPAVQTAGRRRGRDEGSRELSALRGRLATRDVARSRRRRIAAAVAAAGILIAGVGLTRGDRHPALPDLAGPDSGVPLDPTADWEARAAVTLAALHQQLDVIAETEAAWTDHIAEQYQEMATPQAVVEMLEAKEQLLREVAALEAQLGTADRLDQVREEVEVTEVQLAALDAAIGGSPGGVGPSGEDSSGADAANPGSVPDPTAAAGTPEPADPTLEALRLERELLAQSLAAQRAEEERLQRGVEAAREAPLPDAADDTTPLAQEVLELDQSDDPPEPGSPSTSTPPVIAQGRDPDVGPTPQITTSGPDDPGDDDAPEERAEIEPDPSDESEVEGQPEEAGVPNGEREPGPPVREDGPRDRDDEAEVDDRGLAEELGDAADDAVDDLADAVGLGEDDDDAAGDPAGEAGPGDEREDERGNPERRDQPQDGPDRPAPSVLEELGDTADETVDDLQDTVGLGDDDDRADNDRGDEGRAGEDAAASSPRDEDDDLSADGEERDERDQDFRGEAPVIDDLDDGVQDTLEEVTGLGDEEITEDSAAPAERGESGRAPSDDSDDEPEESTESEARPDLENSDGDDGGDGQGTQPGDGDDAAGSIGSDQAEQLRLAGEVLDAVMPTVAEMLDPVLEAAAQEAGGDDSGSDEGVSQEGTFDEGGSDGDGSDEGGSDEGGDPEQSGDMAGSGEAGTDQRPTEDSSDEDSSDQDSRDEDQVDGDQADEDSTEESASDQRSDGQESDGQESEREDAGGEGSAGGSDGLGSEGADR